MMSERGYLRTEATQAVDLARWAPPETRAAREAEEFIREVATPQMVRHSLRTYYFSGIIYDLSPERPPIDREALYVAAMLHDVGLFLPAVSPAEHCFSVGSAREARRIARDAGWDPERVDQTALAITANLNPFVSLEKYGAEAHFMSLGGRAEILAEEWRFHPKNLREVLQRYPRDGFCDDALVHIAREASMNPHGRFACLDPVFQIMLRRCQFSLG
jgi:hypothetical protein